MRYGPPLLVLTFTDDPPLRGPSPPPPPQEKTYLPLLPGAGWDGGLDGFLNAKGKQKAFVRLRLFMSSFLN